MNLFDRLNETYGKINARRLEKQAREQEQQPGATAGRYNPTLGARDITTADGGTITGAKSITGAGVGQDTPVQITQSGKGAIYDFKNPRTPGDLVSANSAQERGGRVGSGGLGGAGMGTGGDTGPVTGYVPQPDGTCSVVVARSLSELPAGAFATAQECLESTRSRGFVCVQGECVETTDAEGRWRSRAECEAALVPAGFTGGQCPGVQYLLQIPIRLGNNAPTTYPDQIVYGPISSVRLVQNGFDTSLRIVARNSLGGALDYTVGAFPGTVSQYSIPNWTPIALTPEPPGGCGNSPGTCPA